MFKFMRKYNKWLLAILGSFLMVTFLFSGTSSIFTPDPRKRVYATTSTTPIRYGEYNRAQLELDFIESFVPDVLKNLGMSKTDADHWILLCREAQGAGLVGLGGDGRSLIPDLVRSELSNSRAVQQLAMQQARANVAQAKGQDPANVSFGDIFTEMQRLMRDQAWQAQLVERMTTNMTAAVGPAAGRARITEEEGYETLAKLRGIQRLQTLYGSAPRLSDKRVAREARRVLGHAQVDGLVIPAARLLDQTQAPTDEKLGALFAKYKADKPGTGEMGFGYLQPPRVKLEWMTVSKQAVEASVALDPIEVSKHYQQNRAQFPGEFNAERAKVEGSLKDQRVGAVMAEIDRVYKTEYRRATRQLRTDQGRKLLPADWAAQQPRMEAMAKEIVQGVHDSAKVDVPLPAVQILADRWTPVDEVSKLPGIGSATFSVGSKQGPIGDLIKQVIELDPTATVGLQVAVPYEQGLKDAAGNVYYFEILAAAVEAPAADLLEVREAVVRDARIADAYERLVGQKDALIAATISAGLESLRTLYPSTDSTPEAEKTEEIKDASVTRNFGSGKALQEQSVRDAVIGALETLGESTKVEEANLPKRVIAVPIPSTKSLGVFVITAHEPASMDVVRAQVTGSVLAQLAMQEVRTGAGVGGGVGGGDADPFGPESLKKRWGYRASRDEGETDEAAKAAGGPGGAGGGKAAEPAKKP